MLTAILLLLPPVQQSKHGQRVLAGLAMVSTLVISLWLLHNSLQQTTYYALGGWQPPFGIVLVADPLASLLVTLTSFLGFCVLLSAFSGHDKEGLYFHPLFLAQITGINGAFLTGDLFNLFVFFEILLIASYALLIFGGGKDKTKAAFHYVTLNLLGSAFFLIALGILYGTLGTLNMADMAIKVASVRTSDQHLVSTGILLLLVVFGLKSAMLPLHFWLAKTYSAAAAPVAALFAIMTKVGIYSLYRVHLQIFGDHANSVANLIIPWLWPLATATVLVGALGVLASKRLKDVASWLVVVSVGTLLFSVALNSEQATAAGLYYLVHSTLVTAALYLLADLISKQRHQAADRFVADKQLAYPTITGFFYIVVALVVVGMPPFSGFIGKVALLQSASGTIQQLWVWPAILLSGLAGLIALSRAASTLFWRLRETGPAASIPLPFWHISAITLLLLVSPLMVILGGDMMDLTAQAASVLHTQQIQLPLADFTETPGATAAK